MVEGFLDYNNGVFVFIKNNTETIISAEQARDFYHGSVQCSESVLDYFEEEEFEGYMAYALRDEL